MARPVPISHGMSRFANQLPPRALVHLTISETTTETFAMWCKTLKHVTRSKELSAKGICPLTSGFTYSNLGF